MESLFAEYFVCLLGCVTLVLLPKVANLLHRHPRALPSHRTTRIHQVPARSAAAPTAVHVPAPLSSAVSSASPSSSQSSLYPHVGEGSAPLPLDVGMTNPSLSRSSSAPPLSPASAASSSSLATGDSSPSFVVAPVAASVPSPSASEEPGGHEPGGASTSAASLLHDATATPSAPAASPAATPLTAGDRIQLAIGNALVNVPRNLEFGANLHPGDVLDAMDTEAEWRLADVLKATADQVFVHYQSWSNKWVHPHSCFFCSFGNRPYFLCLQPLMFPRTNGYRVIPLAYSRLAPKRAATPDQP